MDLTNILNGWAQSWVGFMGARLFDTTVAFIVVALLWGLLRKRTSPQLGYCLFLLVLLKFILPIELTKPAWLTLLSPQHVIHRAEDWTGAPWDLRRPVHVDFSSVSPAPVDGANRQAPTRKEPTAPRTPLSAAAILMLGWAGIVFVLLLGLIRSQWQAYRLVRQARPLPPETLPVDLNELKRLVNVRRSVQIASSPCVIAPVVSGIVWPRLIVPPDFFQSFALSQIRWILLHELAHIRRMDTVVATIQKLLQIVFFFHPVLWVTNRIIDQQREYACDDVALAACGTPRTDCGQGFLSLAHRVNGLPTFSTSVLGRFNQNSEIRRRMMRILDTNRKLRLGLSAGSVALLLIAALIVLPSVRAEDTQVNDNRTLLAQADTENQTILDNSLHEAAAAGDLTRVRSLVSEGAKINAMYKGTKPFEKGTTPLHRAAWNGHKNIVKFLIANGADANAKDDKGTTPLHHAAYRGWEHLVEFLITNGADINATCSESYTPLYDAIWGKDKDTVRVLVANGADVNITANDHGPPLHQAVWYEEKDVAAILLAHGAKLDAKDEEGWTAFRYAVWAGNDEFIELFLAKGADVYPLHLSALLGDLPRLKSLVERGVDVNTADELGWTPLHWATCRGQTSAAKFLLAHGANVNAKNGDNDTPLDYCAHAGGKELTELLLAEGGDVKATHKSGYTPLHRAAFVGHMDVVGLLIAKGADVNVKDVKGRTPLFASAIGGHTEVVEKLINNAANLSVNDKLGLTPLHYAATKGYKDLVDLLILHGVDVDAKRDSNGYTPLHQACCSGHTAVAELLLDKGADPEARNTYGQTPLYVAVGYNQPKTAELLLAKGANIEARNKSGSTPLHNACTNGDKAVAELLIENGADINAKTEAGRTPLSFAKEKGHHEIVELLRKHGAEE